MKKGTKYVAIIKHFEEAIGRTLEKKPSQWEVNAGNFVI